MIIDILDGEHRFSSDKLELIYDGHFHIIYNEFALKSYNNYEGFEFDMNFKPTVQDDSVTYKLIKHNYQMNPAVQVIYLIFLSTSTNNLREKIK